MFKTAAAKIAHNSTLPALGGNQDLRPLQDLITAEKAVLISLQKLSVDYAKASEALRTWGLNEGDDLGDILSASTTLLNHFSSALSQYATHGHAMRDQLKAIRTREEDLEELKRRRRTVVRKAEDADKKLSKMNPEHKNLTMQTDLLNRLRDEIRTMGSDIMTEEAALGDFKRSATRAWMGLKFGGLLECCEKGSIAAEFGKMVIGEISEEITQPGLPRSLYYGQAKTENLVAEASRCINEVVLSTVTSVGSRDRRQYDQDLAPPQSAFSNQGYPPSPTHENKPQPPPPMLDDMGNSQRTFGESGVFGPSSTNNSTDQQPYSSSAFGPRMPAQIQEDGAERATQTMDDFGMNSRSPGLIDPSNTSGSGRFATFPVKMRAPGSGGGYSLQDPSSHKQDQSFSASVAEALDDRTSLETGQATEGTHNLSLSQQTNYAGAGRSRSPGAGPGQVPWTGPTSQSSYHFTPPNASNHVLPPIPGSGSTSSALPPPPPGAAPPNFANPWGDSTREDPMQQQVPTHSHSKVNASLSEDALLAYMTSVQDDLHAEDDHDHEHENEREREHEPTSPAVSTLVAPSQSEEEQRISRHVRFGEVEDVHEQMEKKRSLEKERQHLNANAVVEEGNSPEIGVPQTATAVGAATVGPNEGTRSNSSSPNKNNKPPSHRVPPPTIFTEVDGQALDAEAARDVARELDALNTNQASTSPPDFVNGKRQENEILPSTPDRDRGRLPPIPGQGGEPAPGVGGERERDHSPLSPPQAPFASTRSVSPHRYAELNSTAPPPAPYGVQYSPAQPYQTQDTTSYGSPGAYPQPTTMTPDLSSSNSSSSLPPRFQALNRSSENQNQVPPRFQTGQGQLGQGQQQVPPRFQAGGPTQVPSTMTMVGSGGSDVLADTGRYPRGLSGTSPYTRSSSSLNASTPSGSPGGGGAAMGPRTISAAAFKRPRNTSTDNMGMSASGEQFVKKSLPSSPYPVRDQGERNVSPVPIPNTTATAPVPVPAMSTSTSTSTTSLPPTLPPIESARPQSQAELEDEYDYISAYVNSSNPNSPTQQSFSNATGPAGYGHGHGLAKPAALSSLSSSSLGSGVAQPGRSGGYAEGRFATDLEGEGLR